MKQPLFFCPPFKLLKLSSHMRWRILSIWLFSFALQAQPSATKPIYSHQYFFLQPEQRFFFIDTNHSDLRLYHQLNNAHQDAFGSLSLSNLGGARNQLILPRAEEFWIYHNAGAHQDYFHRKEEVPFYQVRSPLTDARALTGYDRGQLFKILHTQNIHKRWNFFLEYKRLNSLSFYNANQNKQSNVVVSSNYRTKDGVYEVKGYFLTEKMELQEFGGIDSVELFTENLQPTRILLNTRLSQDERTLYNRDIFIGQSLDLLKWLQQRDTTKTNADNKKLSLDHEVRYIRRSFSYQGNGISGFYPDYFYTNGTYLDSLSYQHFENAVYANSVFGDTSKFEFKAGLKQINWSQYNQFYNFSTNGLGLDGQLSGNYREYFALRASLSYLFAGPLANDFRLQGQVNTKLYKSLGLYGSYRLENKRPDLLAQFHVSNNYIWNNNFNSVLTNDLKVGLKWGAQNYLQFRTLSHNNWLYFDANSQAQQATEVVAYSQFDLRQDFEFWSWLHFDNRIVYQIPLNGQAFLPLPDLVTRNALYAEFDLFKGALACLVGGEYNYFSEFNSPSYNPALGRFYLANDYSIGNFGILDLFANFRIAKAVIFLKFENALMGFVPYNYWAAPNYPLNDRNFRVGINWRFFN